MIARRMILDPQIRILSGPSAGQVLPVDESGVHLSDEFMVRLHDGRAVAYVGAGEAQERRSLLDHNHRIRAGDCDFRLEHLQFDPARVTQMFPEITPCDPLRAHNEDVQKYFVALIRNRIGRRLRVAIILNSRGRGLLGYGTYSPELFVVQSEIIDETERGFLPGISDPAGRVFCAKLSHDDRCLGVLYVGAIGGDSFSQQERIEIARIAGYLSIFLAPFEPPSDADSIEPADAVGLRRRNVVYLMGDRIPGVEKMALMLAEGDRAADTVNFVAMCYPDELEPDGGIVWAAFTSAGGLARNKDGTICGIAISDPARFGLGPEGRLGVLYIESSVVNTRDPDVVASLREMAAFASTYLSNTSPKAHNARRPKNMVLAGISGPDKGNVISVNDGPIDFGLAGPDDPEPIYRIESTDEGTVLRVLPEAIEQRPKNVLSLIFERIPATRNAAVFLAEGKPQGKKVGLCAFLRPPKFSIADSDAVIRCFLDKEGVITSGNGAICAVAIKDRKKIGTGLKSRLGVLYIESANDTAADPDQLAKLKEIAVFASKYLSIPTPGQLLKRSNPGRH
jgi:hypothetical protein